MVRHPVKVWGQIKRIAVNAGGIPALLVGEKDNYVRMIQGALWHFHSPHHLSLIDQRVRRVVASREAWGVFLKAAGVSTAAVEVRVGSNSGVVMAIGVGVGVRVERGVRVAVGESVGELVGTGEGSVEEAGVAVPSVASSKSRKPVRKLSNRSAAS
jgi:hypothetical protein